MSDPLAGHTFFQLEPDLAAEVEAIRVDPVSGPVALARRGVDVVRQLTDKHYYERPLHITLEIQGLARALLHARPDSVPLAHLASEMARPLPEFYGRGKDEGARMRGDLRARAETWLAGLEARAERLVDQAARLLPERGVVLTPSRRSATLLAAARRALADGKQVRFLFSPLGESREGGVLQLSLPHAPGLALVVAHAVEPRGVWAPFGTRQLVAAARRASLPCYALAGPEKLVPSNHAFAPPAAARLEQVALAEWTALATGEALQDAEQTRAALAALRLESTLL